MMIGITLDTFKATPFLYYFINFFLVLAVALVLKHMIEGIENVFHDYVHNESVKTLIFTCIRCVLIIIFKYTYIFFILL